LEQGKEIVCQLLTLLENGAFCATTEDNDCEHCDHKAICGNREEVLEHALEKASNNANAVLEPLRQLRKSIAKAASADA
jgi:hypothetical protein